MGPPQNQQGGWGGQNQQGGQNQGPPIGRTPTPHIRALQGGVDPSESQDASHGANQRKLQPLPSYGAAAEPAGRLGQPEPGPVHGTGSISLT